MFDEDSRRLIESLAQRQGFTDVRWVAGEDVVVEQWVRFKCSYACDEYGTRACCPPNTPSVSECRELFHCFEHVAVIHTEKTLAPGEDARSWKREANAKMLELERQVFLAGYYKTLALFAGDCSLCAKCVTTRADCKNPGSARPCPEALAVDVFATVRKLGLPAQVLVERTQAMDRYAFLLVE